MGGELKLPKSALTGWVPLSQPRPSNELIYSRAQTIARDPERLHSIYALPFEVGRIRDVPVPLMGNAMKSRTRCAGNLAECDQIVEVPVEKLKDGFGALGRYVDANFAHHNDGLPCQASRLGSRTEHLKPIAGEMAQESFSHLAASTIASTYKEDAEFFHERPEIVRIAEIAR